MSLIDAIKSNTALISIETIEYDRCFSFITSQVKQLNNEIYDTNAPDTIKSSGFYIGYWNCIDGLSVVNRDGAITKKAGTEDVLRTLNHIIGDISEPGVYVFEGLHYYYDSVNLGKICQLLIKAANELKYKHIVVMGTINGLPNEVSILFTPIDFNLPTKEEITETVKTFSQKVQSCDIDEVVNSLTGLTAYEIKSCIKNAIVKDKGKTIDTKYISERKALSIKKHGFLERVKTNLNFNDIGGAKNLKDYLSKYVPIIKDYESAKKYGLPNPKGILCCGVSGTGKSLTATCFANELGVECYKFDTGTVFNSLVGSTERNAREFFKLADALSPCVIILDEIEKSLAGVRSSDYSDGGVTSRFFASLLNYLQNKTSLSIIFATANNVTQLPPELLRRGRFDSIWFFDLPDERERTEIFKIHLRKVGRDYKKFDIKALVKATDKFNGAEIEGAVHDAMFSAYSNGKDITTADILTAIKTTSLLYSIKEEEINTLRKWAKGKARVANAVDDNHTSTWWASKDGEVIV